MGWETLHVVLSLILTFSSERTPHRAQYIMQYEYLFAYRWSGPPVAFNEPDVYHCVNMVTQPSNSSNSIRSFYH
ncbi:hypothetical protein P691DRAFT_138001 [Macrolepiota fuliginosa MF-IS2]|uniref:Secreted protein n=1 Tax=Macrolepiota fuliginosa MF-IS2 TaxID=1400762 RepID=A0A9P5XAP0_9AGAR|nr:hypothetical protein P691DRAFT_138001 [Macrolepiota fuliginosa MF-IS2]